MGKRDARVDAYIGKAADFAKPILRHIRDLAHRAVPDLEETIKWGMPHFTHRGNLVGLAAFKQHCALHIWKGRLIFKDGDTANGAMGQFGRITALSDLPPDRVLIGYIKQVAKLNEDGVKLPSPPKSKQKKRLAIPSYFKAALRKNRKALAAFDAFSYSHKKEYVNWITEAKRDETRQTRIAQTLAWLAEGKSRNWKYLNC